MGVGCTVGVRSGVGEVLCLGLFLLFLLLDFFLGLMIRRLLLAGAVGPPGLASPIPVRDSGVLRSDVVSVSSSVSLSGVGGRSGNGVRGSFPSKARSRRAVSLLGSRLAAFSFPLCAPLPLQHFRPYESQLRHGVDALAHGQPFLRREQDDPEEHGQHESSRAVRVRTRFRGGRLRLLAGGAAAGGGRVREGAGVSPVVPWAADVVLVASTGSVLMKPQ